MIQAVDPSIDSLIFDYDSTIARVPIDWPAARLAFTSYLKENFPLLIVPEEARVDEMEALALRKYPSEKARVFAFRQALESSVKNCHEPIGPTVAAVHFFSKAQPLRLFILSNNLRATVVDGLNKLGVAAYFEGVLGVDDIGVPKPEPLAFKFFQESYQLEADKCLFIGDNDRTDGGFSSAVGIPFINTQSL